MNHLYLYAMKLQILLFGIASELISANALTIEIPTDASVSDLRTLLVTKYPLLEKMSSYAIAVNEVYTSNETFLKENDVVAIIPPVSGG